MVVDDNNSAWEANLPTKESNLFPPLGTCSWLQMCPLLTALINQEKTQHFGHSVLQEGFLGSQKVIHLQNKAVSQSLASSKALPHEGEGSRRGKSQPLGGDGRFGGKGCVCSSAAPPGVPSDALIAAFFSFKGGCGGESQSALTPYSFSAVSRRLQTLELAWCKVNSLPCTVPRRPF